MQVSLSCKKGSKKGFFLKNILSEIQINCFFQKFIYNFVYPLSIKKEESFFHVFSSRIL